ncbi:MAG: HlyD family type I secretion periplasmic adaptor subunit [Roseitalea porphyridii]|uniref:HlyD family type I secretion periplasmic adaptor subunit n=1 Tax=Roseitalea porphyridii TaxID=1852022 RepID=UPI0032D90B9B
MRSETLDRAPLFARLAIFLVILTVVSFIAWAAFAKVDEIARGDGRVVPLSRTQIVQASQSGVVTEIAVRIGQTVNQGDLLVRLDDTANTASLGESEARSRAYQAKIARLRTEIDDFIDGTFVCPEEIASFSPETCENEEELLRARRENYQNRLSVLQSRFDQRMREIEEAQANLERYSNMVAALAAERDQIAPLVRRDLHPEINLLRLNREIEDMEGQSNVTERSISRLQAAAEEAKLQMDELESQFRQEARSELSATYAELGVVAATISGATDLVRRTDIRSPVDGIVNTLEVNTIGAFVQPGSVVAEIVPTTDTLLVEARISPRDVAFVTAGQEALVKITAYDFSIFGGLRGEVANVSADSIVDEQSGETFYQVHVQTGDSKLGKDGNTHEIRPGMVASVEIMTGQKTVLDYLLKPVTKARQEALTER